MNQEPEKELEKSKGTEMEKPSKEPEKQPKKRAKLVSVKVLARSGKSVLVEYYHDEILARCYIPGNVLIADKADLDELQAGIPYGVDWSKVGTLSVDPVALDREFKRAGIYTSADLQANPVVANLTIAKLAGAVKSNLIKFAKEQEA